MKKISTPFFIWSCFCLSVLLTACSKPEKPETGKEPVVVGNFPAPGLYNNEDGSPIFALVDAAKETLDVEIYEMSDADFIAAIRNAITERHVKVRIVKEPEPLGGCAVFNAPSDKEEKKCAGERSTIEELKTLGLEIVPFNKKELCGKDGDKINERYCFEHGKIVLADKKVAMVSSGNFNSSNLCNIKQNPNKCNRDYSAITYDGDVTQTLGKIFDNDFIGKRYDLKTLLTGPVALKLTVSPYSLEPITKFIDLAEKSIKVQNQYLKELQMNDALIRAAQKPNMRVETLVSSVCSFGWPNDKAKEDTALLYGKFDQAGIISKMFTSQNLVQGRKGYLHAKAIIIDDKFAWMGSVNGSNSALSVNREFGLFFTDEVSVNRLKAVVDADFANNASVTWQESLQCKNDIDPERLRSTAR